MQNEDVLLSRSAKSLHPDSENEYCFENVRIAANLLDVFHFNPLLLRKLQNARNVYEMLKLSVRKFYNSRTCLLCAGDTILFYVLYVWIKVKLKSLMIKQFAYYILLF